MSIDNKQILKEVLAHVLQTFVYVCAEDAEVNNLKLTEKEFVCAEIKTRGLFNAHFFMYAPSSLSLEFAANILGADVEDDIITQNPDDGIKELLNIISCHVLTRIAGAAESFNIGIAESFHYRNEKIWNDFLNKENQIGVLIEGKPIILRMEYV